MIRYLLMLMLLGGITVTGNGQQKSMTSKLRPQHKATVQQWLSGKPSLHLATLGDCLNKKGLAATLKQFGKNYDPYYVVGDFNRDKREDFAIVLVDTRKTKDKFAIAIFNGSATKRNMPAFFEEGWDLSDGGLIKGGGGILAGPFESDNCVILRPRGKGYKIVDCIDE